MRAKHIKVPAKTKSAVFLVTAAAIAFQATNSDLLTFPVDLFPASSKFSEQISTDIHGIVRTFRAISTVACTVADYKYSLRGLQKDSDDYRHKMSEVHLRSAKRILKLCEANKGFYVKAGQYVASQRPVPKEYSSTLSALEDKVAPIPFIAIKEVLMYNLGPDLSEMFFSVNEQPIAAASIAQVHHAVLKSGHQVAIKLDCILCLGRPKFGLYQYKIELFESKPEHKDE